MFPNKLAFAVAGLLLSCGNGKPCVNSPTRKTNVADALFPELAAGAGQAGSATTGTSGSSAAGTVSAGGTASSGGAAGTGGVAPGPASSTSVANGVNSGPVASQCMQMRSASLRTGAFNKVPPERIWLPRILGGQPATHAWAVAFKRGDQQRCGGALIAPNWVITAAHCSIQPSDKAIVGALGLAQAGSDNVYDIVEVRTHSLYRAATSDNDIALVKLMKESKAELIALNESDDDLAGKKVEVAGWGLTQESGSPSNELLEATVNVVSNAVCNTGYGNKATISAFMLCAGKAAGGVDSCQGDSGGPLVIPAQGGQPMKLAGIVSFGVGCGEPNRYGVYTRVSKYIPWIRACEQ